VFFSSLLLLINCFLRVRLDLVCRPIFKLDLIVIVVHVSQQSPPGTTVVPWPCCFSPLPVNRWALLLPPLTPL
jgi:hypothetical protein